MINLLKILTQKQTPKSKVANFFELSARDKKRIIKKAGIGAQKDQQKLLNEYEIYFGKGV